VSTANLSFGRFHLHQIAEAFPESAETLLLDTYLTDEEAASFPCLSCLSCLPPDAASLPTSIATSISTCSRQRHLLDGELGQ
jgi:hypothetical protein